MTRRPRLTAAAAVAASLALVPASASAASLPTAGCAGARAKIGTLGPKKTVRSITCQINAARQAELGAPALRTDPRIASAARKVLAARTFDLADVQRALRASGYIRSGSPWTFARCAPVTVKRSATPNAVAKRLLQTEAFVFGRNHTQVGFALSKNRLFAIGGSSKAPR